MTPGRITREGLERLKLSSETYAKALEAGGTWRGDILFIPAGILGDAVKQYRPDQIQAFEAAQEKGKRRQKIQRTWTATTTGRGGVALPPDYGPRLWAALHNRPGKFTPPEDSKWIADFTRAIPCGACRKHWKDILAATPPEFTSADAYFTWTVTVHNEVNKLLGKPLIGIEEARKIWLTGSTAAATPQ